MIRLQMKGGDVYEGIEKSLKKPKALTLPQSGSRISQGL
jgi:hypothetical protein